MQDPARSLLCVLSQLVSQKVDGVMCSLTDEDARKLSIQVSRHWLVGSRAEVDAGCARSSVASHWVIFIMSWGLVGEGFLRMLWTKIQQSWQKLAQVTSGEVS